MKRLSQLIPLLAALLMSSAVLRAADLVDLIVLAQYADQLRQQGVRGDQFHTLVDQRHEQMMLDHWIRVNNAGVPLKPKEKQAALAALGLQGGPGNNGMGAYVQQMHAQGLTGQALANAIHTEQQRRGIGQGNGKPGIPPGQAKTKPNTDAPGQGSGKPNSKVPDQGNGKPNAGNAGAPGKNAPKGPPAGGGKGGGGGKGKGK